MNGNGPTEPTHRDWARAGMKVAHYRGTGKDSDLFEIKKTVKKGTKIHTQSVILNIHELRALARDFLLK